MVADINLLSNKMYTELDNRVLWFDGESAFTPENLIFGILYNLPKLFCTNIDDAIIKFNSISDEKIDIKTTCNVPTPTLSIPEKYQKIDVLEFILNKIDKHDPNYEQILSRVNMEYSIFKRKNYIDQLKTCIYIIDMFNTNNIVWGTGRGSACCSYILYLIGIHDVDSILYDLDINEFLR